MSRVLLFSCSLDFRYTGFNNSYTEWFENKYQTAVAIGGEWPGINREADTVQALKNDVDRFLSEQKGSISDNWDKLYPGLSNVDLLPCKDTHGAITGFIVTMISGEVEERLFKEQIFNLSNDLLSISNFDSYFLELNEEWEHALGYSNEELKSKPFFDFLHPEDLDRTVEEANALYKDKPRSVKFTNRYRRKDGSYAHLEWNSVIDYKNRLSYSVARDISDIEEKEYRLANLANSVPGAILQYKVNPDGTDELKYISEQVGAVWGVSKEDALSDVSKLWEPILEEDMPEMQASIQQSAVNMSFWDHIWRIHKDGETKWLNGRGYPRKLDDGGILWDTLILDVTNLKATELELKKTIDIKETLFRELHHRIKNNLNLVSSFIYLKATTTRNDELKGFIQETSNRILSISKTHDQLLLLEEVDQLFTTEYLEDLVQSLLASYTSDPDLYITHLTIENHKLSVDQILVLGLLSNEIISNTLKYAYDKKVGGPIYMDFSKVGSDFHFTISDKGIGISTENVFTGASIGVKLIEILCKQLNGELTYNFKSGVNYKVVFPAIENKSMREVGEE